MTVDEARALLPKYADGLLEPENVRELESLLADRPELRAELRAIKEENELLAEALAPLRSSKSARMRLSEAMQDAHRKARDMAEGLPEYGWRVARLAFVFLALVAATVLAQLYPPAESVFQNSLTLFCAIVGIYGMGLLFVLGGRTLARAEALLFQKFSPDETGPSALEVLTVEVFGICAVLGALVMYLTLVPH